MSGYDIVSTALRIKTLNLKYYDRYNSNHNSPPSYPSEFGSVASNKRTYEIRSRKEIRGTGFRIVLVARNLGRPPILSEPATRNSDAHNHNYLNTAVFLPNRFCWLGDDLDLDVRRPFFGITMGQGTQYARPCTNWFKSINTQQLARNHFRQKVHPGNPIKRNPHYEILSVSHMFVYFVPQSRTIVNERSRGRNA